VSLRVSLANLLEPLSPAPVGTRWFNAYTRSASNTWSFATNTGQSDLTPIFLDAGATVIGCAFNVTTAQAATTGVVGIYGSDGNGLPRGLAVSYGGMSMATTGVKTPVGGASVRLAPGLYWVGLFSAATTAVVRALAIDAPRAAALFGYAANADGTAPGCAFRIAASTPPASINPASLSIVTAAPPYVALQVTA
jgi:hypothetical protein